MARPTLPLTRRGAVSAANRLILRQVPHSIMPLSPPNRCLSVGSSPLGLAVRFPFGHHRSEGKDSGNFPNRVLVCSLFRVLANAPAGRFQQNLSAFARSQTRFPSLHRVRFYLRSRIDLHFHNAAAFTDASPEEIWQVQEARC